MTENPVLLDSMSREELIAKAKSVGVEQPQVMTRVELRDEILRCTEADERRLRQARGWFGVARDLVASVVERGLHLPDAASALRGGKVRAASWAPPVATVTLAEIYASQGHRRRALDMLDEVLRREPDHDVAKMLRDKLSEPGGPAVELPAPATTPVEEPESAGQRASSLEPPSAPESEGSFAKASSPTLDILLWRRDPNGRFVAYWELGAQSERDHMKRAPTGSLVCRLRGAYVDGATCRRIEREVELSGSSGTVRLDGLPQRAQLRVALGWRTGDGFVPITLGLSTDAAVAEHQWWEGLVVDPERHDELKAAKERADRELAR